MCDHQNFKAQVNVFRLSQDEGEVIKGYSADVTIKCLECGHPFEFIGFDAGYSPFKPMVNADSTELRIPIKPSTGQTIFEDNKTQLN